MEIYNILFDNTRRIYIKMPLHEYINGGYLVGLEKRNPTLEVIDCLLIDEQAEKRLKDLNDQDL